MKITEQEIKRYASGHSSSEEKKRVETWLKDQDQIFGPAPGEAEQLRSAWNKLSANMSQDGQLTGTPNKRVNYKFLSAIGTIAASLVMLIGLGWLAYQFVTSVPAKKHALLKKVHTEAGQRLTVTLSDGSQIVLNGKSELEYPEKFDGQQRLVKLKGEGFFDIAHDESKPFIVNTDSSFTQVLGTRFNLKAYTDDEQVVLTVERGKVRFGRYDQRDQVVLTKGMQGIMEFHKAVRSSEVLPEEATDWKKDTFVIKNESLASVAKRLERRYAVQVNIESQSLRLLTVTGTFTNTNLEDILSSLAFSTGIDYTIKDKIVTIRK
ncbi:FecR domain-containing protein [Sphingobacterium sp.]|uniref:FecR family protein n=1 Tax=Sphingobacterium sp. TaxID=341027 RepID=UPI0031E1FD31